MEKKNLEEKLRSEGKRFAPNVIDKIYKQVGLEFSVSKENKVVEEKLLEEGKEFVKENYQAIAKEISPKPKFQSGFFRVITHPGFIAGMAATFVAIATTSVVVPVLIIKGRVSNSDNNGEVNNNSDVSPIQYSVNENTISLNIVSGSQTYNAKVKFIVDKEDYVESDSIVCLDDYSAYLIDNFGNTTNINSNSSRYGIGSDKQEINSFTNKYLLTALNYGYLERNNINKANKIVFQIDSSVDGGAYYSKIKSTLEQDILDFSHENRVVVDYEIVSTKQVEIENIDEQDADKVAQIVQIYELSKRLFVGEKRTLTEVYFSDNVNDWIARFVSYDSERLQDYLDLLQFFSDNIKTTERINNMINEFYEFAQGYLNNVKKLNSYLPIFESRIKEIKAYLKVNGSNEVKEALSKGYKELAKYLNDKFYNDHREEIRLDINREPSFEQIEWDYFSNMFDLYQENGHGKEEPPMHRIKPTDPEDYSSYLEENYGKDSSYAKDERTLYKTYADLQELLRKRDGEIKRTNDEFYDAVIWNMDEHDWWNDEDFDNYVCEDENWDNEFDEWWDHHHGGGHGPRRD